METGFVYLIKNKVGGMGGYKIGITINPDRRFKQLEIGAKADVIGLWQSKYFKYLERHLHKVFKKLRVPQSEWFALTEKDVFKVKDILDRSSTCFMFALKEPTVVKQETKPQQQASHVKVIHHPPRYTKPETKPKPKPTPKPERKGPTKAQLANSGHPYQPQPVLDPVVKEEKRYHAPWWAILSVFVLFAGLGRSCNQMMNEQNYQESHSNLTIVRDHRYI